MGFLYRTKLRLGSKLYRFLHRQERNAYRRKLDESGFLTVGRHTYGDPQVDLSEGNSSRVIIGNFCSFARGVVIIPGGEHPTDWVSTYPFRIKWNLPGACADGLPASKGDVVIGSDVWIGTEAMILSGVAIGPGAVIAARSVVTRDVPPYAIVAGVPAKVVRMRFAPEQVAALLRIQWWNWADEKIQVAVPQLSSPQLDEFLKLHDHAQ